MQFLVEFEAVTVELLKRKCLPTLLYGLEACPIKTVDLKSLDYIVVGSFMKFFKTRSNEVVRRCSIAACHLFVLIIERIIFY